MDDLENLVEFANIPNSAKNLTNAFPHPYTPENGKFFIAMANKNQIPTILAIEVDGLAIGGIGVHAQDDNYINNAEMGYWIA
jgi:ribosomal-protein-alanine N-acetyltransferase